MKVTGFKDTIEWYNQNAEQYADTAGQIDTSEDTSLFASLLPEHAKVLDAGCGSGRDSKRLTDKGLFVTGLDLSKGLIHVAKRTYPEINFVVGDLRSLPFEDNSFDGVWSYASLLHLETIGDIKKALGEFYRVLKKNGVLLVLVKAKTGEQKTAIVSDAFSHHDRFFQYFTRDEVKGLVTEQGFEVMKIEQYHETDKNPKGRAEVEWILAVGRKL